VPFRREDGSALLADVILASAIVLVVAAATAAVGVIADATASGLEAARTAAVAVARTGDVEAARSAAIGLAPAGASILVEATGGVARSVVTARIGLPHPVVRRIEVTVLEAVQVPIAPYRSNRE
jgi:hypothetical protein